MSRITASTTSGNSPISGTVTANAGTNLNTSLLALESGGHLASIDSQTATLIAVSSSTNTKLDISNGYQASLPTIATQGGTANGYLLNIQNNTQALAYAPGTSLSGLLGNLSLASVHTSHPTYIDSTASPLSMSTSGLLYVDGSNVTQPISATSLPLPALASTSTLQNTINTTLGNLATSANQTNATQKTQIVDGSGNVINSTNNALSAVLPDGNNQTVTANFTTTGNVLNLNVSGASSCTFMAVGTWGGLIAAYGTNDGTNYQNIPLFSWSDFSKQTFSGDTNAYTFMCAGFKIVQIKAVSIASGTANVKAWLSASVPTTIVTSPNAAAFLSYSYTRDGAGNNVTSTSNALDINLKTSSITLPINPVDSTASGTLTSTGSVTLTLNQGNNTCFIQLGEFNGSSTVVFEASADSGSNWESLTVYSYNGNGVITSPINQTIGNAVAFQLLTANIAGFTNIRVRCTVFHAADSIPITMRGTNAIPPVVTAALLGSLNAGTNSIGTIVQSQNVSRTQKNYYATGAAAGTTTTETAITLTQTSGTAATSSAASFVITSGKKFRITNFSVATRGNTTATAQTTTFNLRINTGGAVTTTSTPVVLAVRSATAATALAWDRAAFPIEDGYEILGDGTLQFGVTAAATFTTNAPTWDVTIIGFEY